MYFVYILFSQKDRKLYIGFTSNLEKRLAQHNAGQVLSTTHRRPFILIGYEMYTKESDARRRELFLKGGKGHEQLKIQYQDIFKHIEYKYR